MTLPVAPSRIGPYRIVSERGRDSMAGVYRAMHEVKHAEAALKVLHQCGPNVGFRTVLVP